MRCKPGDVCVVVRGVPAKNIGRIVTVTQSFYASDWGLHFWCFRASGPLLTNQGGYPLTAIADDCLQPIRPPGAATSKPTHAEDFAHG